MSLTVKEKEHWKDRISARIERAIEGLYRREGLELRKTVQQQSRQRVLDQFGIREAYEHAQSLDVEIEALSSQRRKVLANVNEQLEGLGHAFGYHAGYRDLEQFIERQAKLLERDVLQDTELGRKIVRLKDEQEQLLDTVWLATSSTQIRQLWQDVNAVLEDEPTPLQQQALTYEPVSQTE